MTKKKGPGAVNAQPQCKPTTRPKCNVPSRKIKDLSIPPGIPRPQQWSIIGLLGAVVLAHWKERRRCLAWAARKLVRYIGTFLTVEEVVTPLLEVAAIRGLPPEIAERVVKAALAERGVNIKTKRLR